MLACPSCQSTLTSTRTAHGLYWACPRCSGRAVAVALLRKDVAREAVNRLWSLAREAQTTGSRRCPHCDRRMLEVALPMDGASLRLDVCRTCFFVWFDPHEYQALPPRPAPPPPPPELPAEARELLALHQVEVIGEQARATAGPDHWWQAVLGFLGMPVEHDAPRPVRAPRATAALTVAVTIVSILAFFNLEEAVRQFALVPAQLWRLYGLTLLTAFFLHGGVLHLVGNMYFLWVFGDNVEDHLGPGRYLLLIALATVAGGLLHAALDPRPEIPLIGASGGISGVITFYALRFPQARLGFLLWALWRVRWVRLPAYGFVLLWAIFQVLGAFYQLGGLTNVSALGHLGGAMLGVVAWLAWGRGPAGSLTAR